MINLLPPETKKAYRYAKRNVKLLHWLAASVVGLVGLLIIGTYGLLSLQANVSKYSRQVDSIEVSLRDQHLKETKAQVQDITNSFKLVVKVLSQEVLFSQLLKQMATVMPKGANLTTLNIGKIQGGLDIAAAATDYNTATQVQVNLSDLANKIFAKADIVNIVCDSKSALNPNYPCTINIRALFADNNPFLFINQKAAL
ncbi:MAG TPA: hypothetical protein VLG37_05190 [Candidatus Saccharimonadales bacterium]|nr:hypothetical protein [Candidatus Saccharimonadales bacterium]